LQSCTAYSSASVNYATSAGKATNDGDNNAISSTYLKLSGGTLTNTLTVQSGGVWVQGGSAAGNNTARLSLTAGMPTELKYNDSKRGTRIYSNGIAFADPYNGNSNNDSAWIRHIEETANQGTLEIATGDDAANEEIVVRRYNTSNVVKQEVKLIDTSGCARFPVYVYIQRSDVDASKTNNNVSSDIWPAFLIVDKSDRALMRIESTVKTDGTLGSTWYIRNYNTSGTVTGAGGITMLMSKDGTLTYSISSPANFRSALSLDSTYLKLSAGSGSPLTDNLYLKTSGDWAYSLRFCTGAKTGTNYTTIAQNDWGMLYYGFPAKQNSDNTYLSARFIFRQMSPTSSGTCTSYYDQYQLPNATIGKSANNTYTILTTKSAVTVGQGGTGATSAATALKNLGIKKTTITGSTNSDGNISVSSLRVDQHIILACYSTKSEPNLVCMPYRDRTSTDEKYWAIHVAKSTQGGWDDYSNKTGQAITIWYMDKPTE